MEAIKLKAATNENNQRALLTIKGYVGETRRLLHLPAPRHAAFLYHLPRLSALPGKLVNYQKDSRSVMAPMSIDAVAPAGGISSTIDDMAIWMKMLVSMGTLLNNPIEFGRRTSTSMFNKLD